jgi:hypothetical protein
MTTFVVSLSIALVLTSLFAFRHHNWRRPRLLATYFVAFMGLEWLAEAFLLPPGAIPVEVAYVCFPLSFAFATACYGMHRYQQHAATGDERG